MSLLPDARLLDLWNNSDSRYDFLLLKDILNLAEQLLQGQRSSDTSQGRVAFHCLSTAIQIGLKVLNSPTLSPESKEKTQTYIVNVLFPRLEEVKKSLASGTLNEKQDLKEMQNMALVLFKGAEDQHIQGRANKETIKSYKQCSTLIQCVKECDANSEPRVFEERLINVSKEAKIRMISLIKCLKEGRPIPPLEPSSMSKKGEDGAEVDSINSELSQMLMSLPGSTSLSSGAAPNISMPPRMISGGGGELSHPLQFSHQPGDFPVQVSRGPINEMANSMGRSGAVSSLSGVIPTASQGPSVPSYEPTNSTGASASASKGFIGNVAMADAHEYSKFVVTALKFERNAQMGLHFVTLALNSIRQGSLLNVPRATRAVTDEAVKHACAAVEALAGGNKVMTQPENAIKELRAVIAELNSGGG